MLLCLYEQRALLRQSPAKAVGFVHKAFKGYRKMTAVRPNITKFPVCRKRFGQYLRQQGCSLGKKFGFAVDFSGFVVYNDYRVVKSAKKWGCFPEMHSRMAKAAQNQAHRAREVNTLSENTGRKPTLMGTFYQSMDAKGRVTFPAKLREIIGESFFITRGSDGCLFVFSDEEFYSRAEKIGKMPISQARDLQRAFMANASEVETDKQGRVLITPSLRDYAGLDKEVVVIGVSDRCEIWDKQAWEKFNASVDLGALMDALEGLDF